MSGLIGPVMLDLMGTELTSDEQTLLQHPLVGGVILFTRNYVSMNQITELCQAIREARTTPILIAVDQEGGRVQRFRESFTRLPSMGSIGESYDQSPDEAVLLAEACGWIMASEMLAIGVDLSFAPVLDLNKQMNQVVGDRAFHRYPEGVITLARALIKGMRAAGMASTGKHFPGHGTTAVDSHVGIPIDSRDLSTIITDDMQPFIALAKELDAIMPAHILFPAVDNKAVGFSEYWLQSVLRTQLQFSGIIFSDDLNMQGASMGGDYSARSEAALNAGCDMILICNNRPAATEILNYLQKHSSLIEDKHFNKFQGRFSHTMTQLHQTEEWQAKQELLYRKIVC
jgi:beta-N-acetylhexosaminidase